VNQGIGARLAPGSEIRNDGIDSRFRVIGRTMAEPDPMPTFDELLSHSRWVRKLARELVVDEHRADDVVQATWMAALTRPPADSSNLRGWLSRVVRNFAHEFGRSEGRRHQREREVARPEALPSMAEATERAQTQRDLVDHLLKLDEPFRSVLLLRYFDDLPPRKIAERLGVPVATVRSRQARGLERLRRSLQGEKGDDEKWLGALSLLALANRSGTAADTCIRIGRTLVKKKIAVAAAALLLMCLTVLWMHRPGKGPSSVGARATTSANAIDHERPTSPELAESPVGVEQERVSVNSTPSGEHSMRGRVLDAATDDPVAGADVALYAPKKKRLRDLSPDSLALMQVQSDGALSPRAHPVFASNPNDLQRAGIEEMEVLDVPESGDVPIARTTSGSDGGFTLSSEQAAGFLIVRAAGFGERRQAWPRAAPAQEAEVRDVYVARSHPLRGRVLDEKGAPVARRLRFGTYEHVKPVFVSERDATDPPLHDDAQLLETKEDGTFEWEFASQMVSVFSAEPDLVVLECGTLAPNGRGCVSEGWLTPGKEPGDIAIVVRGVTVLIVSDATSGAPIERFHLQTRQVGSVSVPREWNAWLQAPNGEKQLVMANFGDPRFMSQHGNVRQECTIWAPGHQPKTLTIDEPWKAQHIEVKLEPGNQLQISGRVSRAGVAVVGAPVVLFSIHDMEHWYVYPRTDEGHWTPFTAMQSDSAGNFALDVLPGSYLAKVGPLDEYVLVPCTAPGDPIAVDLAQHAKLLVRVHSVDGSLVEHCKLQLTRPDAGQWESETDARGEARCTDASPGVDVLRASRVRRPTSEEQADVMRNVVVHAGVDNVIEITLPEDRPKYAKLVVDGTGALSDWHVQKAGWPDYMQVGVESSGRIPIDLRSTSSLTLSSATTQRRIAWLPDDAPDGFEIHVRVDGPGYDGVLTARGGASVAYIWVLAEESGKSWNAQVHSVSITDARGRFHLTGLRDTEYRLQFLMGEQRASSDFMSMTVVPKSKPAAPPVQLSIDLPARRGDGFAGVDVVTVSGQVTTEDGKPSRQRITIDCVLERQDHQLTVSQSSKPDTDGMYSLTVPKASKYRAHFWSATTKKMSEPTEWIATGGDREIHDFVLP
jgi:RNA polymerase sigma-70 factor (ECF subfamily)